MPDTPGPRHYAALYSIVSQFEALMLAGPDTGSTLRDDARQRKALVALAVRAKQLLAQIRADGAIPPKEPS